MKLIDIALAEVGTKEVPANSNKVKYNTWIWSKEVQDGYNIKGDKDPSAKYPWCGAFVSWVYDQASMPIQHAGLTKGFVGCPYAVNHVKDWGKIVTVPQPGDIFFADWEGDGKFDHTGLFIKDNGGGLFQSIEGNTSFGNDSNGGEVMIRERKYKTMIFIRPNSKV